MSEPARSPAAERMRRTRTRRREGKVYIGMEVSERWLEQLTEAGVLSDDDLSDPTALGQAIEGYTTMWPRPCPVCGAFRT